MRRKNLFLFTLKNTLTSRIFGIYLLVLFLLSPLPLLLEYFTRLYYRRVSLNGRSYLNMMSFSLYYVFFIVVAFAILIPFVLSQNKMAMGDKLSKSKRTFWRNMSLLCLLGVLGICWALCSYALFAVILIPICAATRIDPHWSFTLPSLLEPFLLSFFNIFSFIVLFLFISTLCKRKLPAVLINLSLWGISTYLYIPFQRNLVFPAGITFTQAMKDQVRLYNFLKSFNPGSLAVEISQLNVFNAENLHKMLLRSLCFTIPLLLIAFLVVCIKDHLARRSAD